ncbi:uncharacterized protein LOC136031041 [Artemia franciscana]|uniref:uncharacterized protein LOC136031041 n=1 Tax=Artemia franciscana TaxID=6661 RepID=UPI0032D9D5E7
MLSEWRRWRRVAFRKFSLKSLFMAFVHEAGHENKKAYEDDLRKYGISRTLKARAPPIDINNDPAFKKSSKAFSHISKNLRLQGFDKSGSQNTAHCVIPQDDLRLLYAYWSDFTDLNKAVQKVWFELDFFGICGGKEDAKNLKKGDISVQFDKEKDRRFLHRSTRHSNLRLYEQPGRNCCPVKSFEQYNMSLCQETALFFTVPMTTIPLANGISAIMKKISTAAKLSKKYPNGSVKYTASKLCEALYSEGPIGSNITLQDYFYTVMVDQKMQNDDLLFPSSLVCNNRTSLLVGDNNEDQMENEYPYTHLKTEQELENGSNPSEGDNHSSHPWFEPQLMQEEKCDCSSNLRNLIEVLIRKQEEDKEIRERELELRKQEISLLSEILSVQKRQLELKKT